MAVRMNRAVADRSTDDSQHVTKCFRPRGLTDAGMITFRECERSLKVQCHFILTLYEHQSNVHVNRQAMYGNSL
jgi:hypothetical protein